jgi:hypothetical protein
MMGSGNSLQVLPPFVGYGFVFRLGRCQINLQCHWARQQPICKEPALVHAVLGIATTILGAEGMPAFTLTVCA